MGVRGGGGKRMAESHELALAKVRQVVGSIFVIVAVKLCIFRQT